ncbi:MAG TPA: DUF2892 domain-containing protein [Solirubrobacterales bacterium]|jgi:hypothetical protein
MSTVAAPHAEHEPRAGFSTSREPARWPLERILFLMAGTMTGLSAVLAALVSPWFLLLTGFVALNQLAYVTFGNCPSSLVLRRYFGVRAGCDR